MVTSALLQMDIAFHLRYTSLMLLCWVCSALCSHHLHVCTRHPGHCL